MRISALNNIELTADEFSYFEQLSAAAMRKITKYCIFSFPEMFPGVTHKIAIESNYLRKNMRLLILADCTLYNSTFMPTLRTLMEQLPNATE